MWRVAEPTVERLIQYLRVVEAFKKEGRYLVSSQEIADAMGIKATQVRKDLSFFGEVGKRGVGYNVSKLIDHLRYILFPSKEQKLAIVGAGKLGGALASYSGFEEDKGIYRVVALFDNDPQKIGDEIGGIKIYDIKDFHDIAEELDVRIVILTVPASVTQEVVDHILSTGRINGILNFSPVTPIVPKEVVLYNVDITTELKKVLFYVRQKRKRKKKKDF